MRARGKNFLAFRIRFYGWCYQRMSWYLTPNEISAFQLQANVFWMTHYFFPDHEVTKKCLVETPNQLHGTFGWSRCQNKCWKMNHATANVVAKFWNTFSSSINQRTFCLWNILISFILDNRLLFSVKNHRRNIWKDTTNYRIIKILNLFKHWL